MKKLSLIALLVLMVFAAAPTAFATCAPAGIGTGGPYSTSYDHIANGAPNRDECWNPFKAFYTTTAPSPWGFINAYEFNYAGSINQSFVVPPTMTATRWQLRWTLYFDDPNNNAAWNRFSVEVRNMTTNAILATYTFDGGQGDQNWVTHSKDFNGNFAGQTIRVRFKGSKGYPDTTIRVMGVTLWQY